MLRIILKENNKDLSGNNKSIFSLNLYPSKWSKSIEMNSDFTYKFGWRLFRLAMRIALTFVFLWRWVDGWFNLFIYLPVSESGMPIFLVFIVLRSLTQVLFFDCCWLFVKFTWGIAANFWCLRLWHYFYLIICCSN